MSVIVHYGEWPAAEWATPPLPDPDLRPYSSAQRSFCPETILRQHLPLLCDHRTVQPPPLQTVLVISITFTGPICSGLNLPARSEGGSCRVNRDAMLLFVWVCAPCACVCQCVGMYVHLSIHPSIYLPIYPSIDDYVYISKL